MKSIRTTTVALVGAALLALGALTGCSSDSDDKSSDKTTSSNASRPDESKDAGGATDGGSGDDTEFCAFFDSVASVDPADDAAVVEFWEDWKASAPSDLAGDFDVIIEAYEMVRDGDTAGFNDMVEDMVDANVKVTARAREVCS